MGGTDEATLTFLGKARDLAEQLGYVDVTCFALNVAGLGLADTGGDGMPPVQESLRIALEEALPARVGGSYSSLLEACAKLHRFADSERYYAEGLAYCEGRELGVFSVCHPRLARPHPDDAGTVGRGGADLCPDAGQPGYLTGQPAEPALCPGHHPGTPRRRTGHGTCWTGRSDSPRGPANRRGSRRCGRPARS